MDLSYRQLKAFIALIDTKSFTLAAEKICVSQSALSQILKKLESQLNISLIEKKGRQFYATAAGENLYREACYITHRLERLKQDNAFPDAQSLTVSALYTMASTIVPNVLQRLTQDVSIFNFKLYESRVDDVENAVQSGFADIGIATRPKDVSIQFKPLFSDYLCFACHTSHPLAKYTQISWEMAAKYTNIGVAPNNSLRSIADLAFLEYGLHHDPDINISHTATIIGMINNKIGSAILSSSIAYIDGGEDNRFIPILPNKFRDIGLLTHSENKNKLVPIFSQYVSGCLKTWEPVDKKYIILR